MADHRAMRMNLALLVTVLLMVNPSFVLSQDVNGVRPLLTPGRGGLESILPKDTHVLSDPASIEGFMRALEGSPPDWSALQGPHGIGDDERLFALNRERDRLRVGRAALRQRVTFIWFGEFTAYDPRTGGFSVAIGPKMVPTRWGIVRFKPEGLPSEMVVVPEPSRRDALRAELARGDRIEVDVAMTGRLIHDESIIYGFAHDEPGHGMIMPVVRIERIDYVPVQ